MTDPAFSVTVPPLVLVALTDVMVNAFPSASVSLPSNCAKLRVAELSVLMAVPSVRSRRPGTNKENREFFQ